MKPHEAKPRLVNGGLYAEHVLDLGDGTGVIDWGRFGQGPLELDAGIFLASASLPGFRDEPRAAGAAQAEQVAKVFLDREARFALLHLACQQNGAG